MKLKIMPVRNKIFIKDLFPLPKHILGHGRPMVKPPNFYSSYAYGLYIVVIFIKSLLISFISH